MDHALMGNHQADIEKYDIPRKPFRLETLLPVSIKPGYHSVKKIKAKN